MRVDLFVIDGQNDFCAAGTEPDDWAWPEGGKRAGALYVQGADKEAQLVADMIMRLSDPAHQGGHKISKIHSTLDSHHYLDGAHNVAWKNGNTGAEANPFTIVTNADVESQNFVPTMAMGIWEGQHVTALEWAKKYTKALEDRDRNPLCLWPPHCLIGSWGQQVYKPLMDAYTEWCKTTRAWINWISKGQWPWTEHYSAMIADVPDPTRQETQMNAGVVNDAAEADIILWTGWAGSHCLKWTAQDSVDFFGQGENEFVKKSVFCEDAAAEVVGPDPDTNKLFKQWKDDFLHDMKTRGAKITTTDKFLKAA